MKHVVIKMPMNTFWRLVVIMIIKLWGNNPFIEGGVEVMGALVVMFEHVMSEAILLIQIMTISQCFMIWVEAVRIMS